MLRQIYPYAQTMLMPSVVSYQMAFRIFVLTFISQYLDPHNSSSFIFV